MAEQGANEELLWGIHPVLELLRLQPRKVREIMVQQHKGGRKLQEIIDLAQQQGIKVRFLPAQRFPGTAQQNHQGVMARVAPVATTSLDDLLSDLRQEEHPIVVALDLIQDPHNLGAIIRSAAAAGACGVIMTKDRSAPLNATAAKAAAGAMAHVKLCLVTNLAAALETLKEKGFWVYGAAGEARQSLYRTRFSGPVCLVVGGEGKGIRPLIREHCDVIVSIPMAGTLNSLNASVAAGIILFEMVRQRRSGL